MKALKVIVAVVLLVALASGAYFVVSRQNTRDLHLAAATAAPIEGMPGQVGIFVQIENLDGPDRLIDVKSPAATRAWIDAPTAALAIPQNSTPALAADGAFVRLAGVSGDLTDGQIIPVTLTFEKAGQQSVQARLSTPKATGVAHEFGLFGIGDVCRVGDGEPAPEIALTTRRDGDGWIVEVDAKDFEFTPDLADGLHVAGTGHGHLYLNGLKLQRLYAPSARIGALPPGTHEVRVTLNTNDHRAYVVGDTPVTAQTVISSD